MILAGGQGSRLGVLTENLAKPAVPFGGKFRIIDFSLSNCTNSHIENVGVLTQYSPLLLNCTIGIGGHWNLDRKNGGVRVLPPYIKKYGGEWYKGTANAIYQNIDYIEQYNPDYVLILSGDHVYKMDYSKMIEFHKEKGADATIAVLEVPWEEASRFGIMDTDDQYRIVEFQEKPEKPKNNLASMGIYVFNWPVLKKYLEEDEADKDSSKDFGKDVIPKMLAAGSKMFAYPFSGYWKDVGTIESLWEANMDLLADEPQLHLYDSNWPIYSVNLDEPPHYVAPSGKVEHSLLNEGCEVYGTVSNSVISQSVTVGKGAVIENSIIMPNVKIGENVIIKRAIVGSGSTVRANSRIGNGENSHAPITVVGENRTVAENSVVTDEL
ncbi:glucose-1-phosphate adenylyltransferase [Desulfitispora alkaliphila]|uniref:glucose-1-phosphate adenylyltransferase n=1 Tax=Desulfitispora alkaliphila TaxID=622674 RepID=UPI003D1CCAAB